MKYEVLSDSCRVCLKKSRTCRSIFEPYDDKDIAPSEKLKWVTGVDVSWDADLPVLPELICKTCEISVNMAFSLRNRARKSDQIIHIYCNRLNKDNIIVELNTGRKIKLCKELTLKVIQKSRPPEDVVNSDKKKVDSEKVEEADEVINLDNIEHETDTKEVNDSLSDIDENYDDAEDDNEVDEEFQIDDEEITNDDHLCPSDNGADNILTGGLNAKPITIADESTKQEIKRKVVYNAAEIAKQLDESKKYEVISWKQAEKEDSIPIFKLRVKGVKTNELSNDFICEVCGNIYRQKHRLMEHMRRHNKEKTYECEICKKRFLVAEGLRRHILTHGAQRPFKCNFCARTFYNPSARKAHEKVHSGAKPYVCHICTKAFAYSCSLHKHMLIHANKKLYRCQYCYKEFRLQHHLKQHVETQIHKDAVAEYLSSQLADTKAED